MIFILFIGMKEFVFIQFGDQVLKTLESDWKNIKLECIELGSTIEKNNGKVLDILKVFF